MFKTIAYLMIRNLGWLLAFAGLIMPGMLIFDEFTTTPVRATITEVGYVCEKRVCLLGRCNWQREKCSELDGSSAAGEEVHRKPRAKVEFQTDEGMAEVWARFTKLNIERAKVGDEVDVLYRGPAPYYVSAPFSHLQAALGLLVSLLGGVLLVITGRNREELS